MHELVLTHDVTCICGTVRDDRVCYELAVHDHVNDFRCFYNTKRSAATDMFRLVQRCACACVCLVFELDCKIARFYKILHPIMFGKT